MHLLWILNYSDGENSLLDIAEKSTFTFSDLRQAADILLEHELSFLVGTGTRVLLRSSGKLFRRVQVGGGFESG